MKYSFIKENSDSFAVEKMCHVFEVSPSGYYHWIKAPESDRSRENRKLLFHIKVAHENNRQVYGSPRITAELREMGFACGKNRVARIMRENGIVAKGKKKFKVTTDSKHNLPVAPNLLNQNFTVSTPDTVWVSDITYIWTNEGWLYLATVLDLYSRRIVGWSMSERIKRQLVIDAMNQAINRRNPCPGLICHSDRGSQYASNDYQALLEKNGFVCSMSKKGDCFDNACAETFFGTLKTELVYLEKFKTRKEARGKIFDYIEVFYNRFRKHSTLGYKSPAEFEMQNLKKVA